jgi:hypothetical protein
MVLIAHFCGFLQTVPGVYPNTFDANLRIVESPFVYITGASRGDRSKTDTQKRGRKSVRGREYHLGATYVSEVA